MVTCLSSVPTSGKYPIVTLIIQASSLDLFKAEESGYTTGITTVSGVGQAAYSLHSENQEGGQNMVLAYDKSLAISAEASASVSQLCALINAIYSHI